MCMGSARIRRGAPGVPPDYVATQLRMKKMGRALSHDDEEEDAQVSAVSVDTLAITSKPAALSGGLDEKCTNKYTSLC
ncbi:hypothetical protein Hamer_G022882, partial [Homarus americanus]